MRIWLRQTNESAKAYEAAKAYFEMGAARSLEAVHTKFKKSARLIARWSSNHDWVSRAKAYDEYQQDIQEKAREEAARKEAVKWAERREALRNEEWLLAERIHVKLGQMLDFPVYQLEHTGNKTIIKPMKWGVRDLSRMAETVTKLYRTSAGLPVETTRQEITGADGGAIVVNAADDFDSRMAALITRISKEEISSEPESKR